MEPGDCLRNEARAARSLNSPIMNDACVFSHLMSVTEQQTF